MLRESPPLAPLLLLLTCCGSVRYGDAVGLGSTSGAAPRFTSEPTSRVQYLQRGGVRLQCGARGAPPPALSWLLAADDTELYSLPGVRRVSANGTLEILPSTATGGPVVTPGTVRCRAANVHGIALSRDVVLEPVLEPAWELQAAVEGGGAAGGGVAALTCRALPPLPALPALPAMLQVRWYREEELLDLDSPTPESRYILAGESLLIRAVTAQDALSYSCEARHRLSGRTRRSEPVRLHVTGAASRHAPRLLPAPGDVRVRGRGASACVPCVALHQPPPHYTWYREREGRLHAVGAAAEGAEGAEGAWVWAGGAALCGREGRVLAGAWLCKAYNAFGDAARQVRVHAEEPLRVSVAPERVVAAAGGTVRLSCSPSWNGAALEWMHDGRVCGAGATLTLREVSRAAQGVYQCRARTASQHAQATAHLLLGDSPPELQYTFIEQALRPGGAVSLRCVAGGTPSPSLAWLLDDQPLDQYRTHRYQISSESTLRGDTVSTLNMTEAGAGDGGRYSCRASNRLGVATHSATLNIYGPPSIRAAGPVRVVAGSNATVHCPYAGYPISSVSWRRRGAGASVSGAGRVSARRGVLALSPALSADAGHYTCVVLAPDGQQAQRDIEIQVRNPPKISPFMFSSELTEGSSAQVLCGVSSGDKPMYFSWTKDGASLPSNLQIEEKSLNEFSLLMFSELSARHSGEYTCRVSNHAATLNYTAVLSVKVAPAWSTEPLDAAVPLGAPIVLECAARGYPTPIITWQRRIGEGGPGGPDSDRWEPVGGAWSGAAGASNGDGEELVRGTEAGRAGGGRGSGALRAPAASRQLQGMYRCTADNGVGPPLLKHVNLTVHEPANFERSAGNVSCVRGGAASLSCHALGDAPLSVHWSHRGLALDLSSYRWTVSEVRTREGVRSTLQLRAAEREDAGEYRCLAHNQYGRSELLMFLHVEEPPEAPRNVRLGGVGSRWVRVQWGTASGALGGRGEERYSALCTALHSLPGTEPPHNTFNLTLESWTDHSSDPDRVRALAATLVGLRPAAAYSLRVIAENHVGRSPHSEPLLFTTLDEAPSSAPRNVRLQPIGPGELHVSWSAPARDGWNGELLGYVVTWHELERYEEPDVEAEIRNALGGRVTLRGVGSSATLTLVGLRPAARFGVAVRAFSRAGAGPASPSVYATTLDGAPEEPPTSVTCEAGSSRSLRVRWSQPLGAGPSVGYDVHYVPLYPSPPWSGAVETVSVRGLAATLQGLAAGTNYSVWVCARAAAGPGPPSAPTPCLTPDDVPGSVRELRVLAAGADALRVTWLPPVITPTHTYYTLYSRELGKSDGAERALRVEGGSAGEEVRREVRGLRALAHEVWVVAGGGAGLGPPSRPVSATPRDPGPARISSLGRTTVTSRGSSVRLRCAALGAPPLRWSWSPLPPTHAITEAGDLIVHKAEVVLSGNYTCSVRNAGGSDAVVHRLVVVTSPEAPVPRLLRAERYALHVTWPVPLDAGAPLLGYTLRWARQAGAESRRELPGSVRMTSLRQLACGAWYHVTLQAHNAAGASPPSAPLRARTEGDKAVAAPGKEFVWSNSSVLRLNLLAWQTPCPASWRIALRPVGASFSGTPEAGWSPIDTDQETAQASGLKPGTWYEIRAVASSPAGDTLALYRAATLTRTGERLGEAVEVAAEVRSGRPGEGAGAGAGGGGWRDLVPPALHAAWLAVLVGATLGSVSMWRRRRGGCGRRRECPASAPVPQLYSTEPGKRSGEKLATPEGAGDPEEISPYATFSMSGGGEGLGACAGAGCPLPGVGAGAAGGCALHLHTFGRGGERGPQLVVPPPRPNLLSHPGMWCEYGAVVEARDTESESSGSGSPCAGCQRAPPRAPRPGPRAPPAAAAAAAAAARCWSPAHERETARGAQSRAAAGVPIESFKNL